MMPCDWVNGRVLQRRSHEGSRGVLEGVTKKGYQSNKHVGKGGGRERELLISMRLGTGQIT